MTDYVTDTANILPTLGFSVSDITSANYIVDENGNNVWIKVVGGDSNSASFIGIENDNLDYTKLMEWVNDGDITITAADPYPTNTE